MHTGMDLLLKERDIMEYYNTFYNSQKTLSLPLKNDNIL